MVHKNTIKFILKNGGFEKIIRAICFFVNDKIKRSNITFKKIKLILGKYEFQTIENDEGISTELQIYESHEPLTTHLIINELKQNKITTKSSKCKRKINVKTNQFIIDKVCAKLAGFNFQNIFLIFNT